jgi:hypothetical protein
MVSLFKYIQELKKILAKRTRPIPEIGKIEVKKKSWIEVKLCAVHRAGIFKQSMGARTE